MRERSELPADINWGAETHTVAILRLGALVEEPSLGVTERTVAFANFLANRLDRSVKADISVDVEPVVDPVTFARTALEAIYDLEDGSDFITEEELDQSINTLIGLDTPDYINLVKEIPVIAGIAFDDDFAARVAELLSQGNSELYPTPEA
jgi:hypothetical protein